MALIIEENAMPTGTSSYRTRLMASVTALVGLSVVSGCASRTVTATDSAPPTVTAPQPVVNQQPVAPSPPSYPLDPLVPGEVEEVEGDFERIFIPPLPTTN